MPGHLWEISEINGDKYLIVTTSNNEEQARELFRKVLGSSADIYKVKYVSFVHAIEG